MENFTPIATLKKKKKINKLLIIGNLLLVVIMAIGGYFYYNNVLLTKEQKAETYSDCLANGGGNAGGTNNSGITNCVYDNGCYWDVCTKWSSPPTGTGASGTCVEWGTTRYNSCTGGRAGWAGCPAGLKISCGLPTDPGATQDTNYIGTCNQYSPSMWALGGVNCQINCLCCPSGSTYNCVTSSNTYEYATESRKKYICQNNNHADKYVSSRPNPAYNSSLPPEDNPLCTEDGIKANGNINWNCLDTLTTCAPSVCSCTGTSVTNTPIPTATDIPVLTNTPIPTATDIPILTNTPTPTRTPTPTPTPVISNTPSPTPTGTIVPSNTPTATPTGTLVPTNTPTSTPVLTNTPGPSATPTEIILAQVSPSPTSTTQLLQTGVLKSFLYWIPAVIILVGLIL
ncbi:MAG: hypothetical protein AAB705_01795 [Patescibacteria group bacterium]